MSLCDLYNVIFNTFKWVFFLYYIVFCSKVGVFKWVLGQESHASALCFGITYRGQNKVHLVKKEEKFQFIWTGRLKWDCVENLSTIIRGKGGKIPVDTYQDCSNKLILPKLPSAYDELSMYDFL